VKFRWPWTRRHVGHDMTCREAVSLVTAYLDGALAPGECDRFERHLDECPHCREHMKQIEATIIVAGEVRADDLDPLARDDLMDLYRRWRREGEGD
jgi:anti-sigma factor RsiW